MHHPYRKLGKNKARRDDRNLMMASITKPHALPIPPEYSVSAKYPAVRPRMFRNDVLGDCVMAYRGNQTLYFEYAEQKKLLAIKDSEIEKEYFKETGGGDDGLYVLDSLKAWRLGWRAAGAVYKIKAFAEINRRNRDEVRSTTFSDLGACLGIELPLSAQKEINAGKPWSITSGTGAKPGSWGGHCVMLVGYDAKYLTCVTWGGLQRLTWEWFNAYCSEAYAVIDAIDSTKQKRMIDGQEVDSFLSRIAA